MSWAAGALRAFGALMAAHYSLVAGRLRVEVATRRVNGNPTPAAFAEADVAAAAREAAERVGFDAWVAYGRAMGFIEVTVVGNDKDPGRCNGPGSPERRS